jgi:hypothetical protein
MGNAEYEIAQCPARIRTRLLPALSANSLRKCPPKCFRDLWVFASYASVFRYFALVVEVIFSAECGQSPRRKVSIEENTRSGLSSQGK